MNLNDDQFMENAISEIFGSRYPHERISVIPCGNHSYDRNRVYKVEVSGQLFVIKFIASEHRVLRERTVIPMVQTINPLKILATGKYGNQIDWILYNHVDGWVLEEVIDDFDLDQKRHLFREIGEIMGAFHALRTFDYFGDWTSERQSALTAYRDYIISDCERQIKMVMAQPVVDQDALMAAVRRLRDEYENITPLKLGRLCHRDFDGRNILVSIHADEGIHISGILDFEKTVVHNAHFDIAALYRKYFLIEPKLIPYFTEGYRKYLTIEDDFNQSLRFYLYRSAIDLLSWSNEISSEFFSEANRYLKRLVAMDAHLKQYHL